MDPEKQPPSTDTLPAFRVRQARASLGDAVIRMKKKEYDELLVKEPKAALRYIDESDGEVILVGSSLELDQRLQEPVERAAQSVAGVPIDLYATGSSPMHSFDIQREDNVLDAWRTYDQRTTAEGQKAKEHFFGKAVDLSEDIQGRLQRDHEAGTVEEDTQKDIRRSSWTDADSAPFVCTTCVPPRGFVRKWNLTKHLEIHHKSSEACKPVTTGDLQSVPQTYHKSSEARRPVTTGDLMSVPQTQPGLSSEHRVQKQKPEVQKNNVQFGQPSPPRSTLRVSKQGEQNSASHATRWASYGDLPASFNQATSSEPCTTATEEKHSEASKNTPRSAFDIMTTATANQQVRSSTVQVPSTPKQSKEHQPLLEMFWKQNAQRKGIEIMPTGKDYHPILDLYETQLQQLSVSGQQKPPTAESEPKLAQSVTDEIATPTATISQAENEDVRGHPGELLTLSIQSLLHGVSQLASAFKLTNSELQHQIAVAQKDIPRNIEKALKSSLRTLESLRANLPQAKASPPSPQANKGTQAERPSTSDRSTNTASPLEQAFLKAKDDTIAALDSASMKLASAQPAEKGPVSETKLDYMRLRNAELESLLRERDLSHEGSKTDMVARLLCHDSLNALDFARTKPASAQPVEKEALPQINVGYTNLNYIELQSLLNERDLPWDGDSKADMVARLIDHDSLTALDSASTRFASTKLAEKETLSETKVDYTELNTTYLQRLLKERNLPTSGKRAQLVANLVNHDLVVALEARLSPAQRAEKEALEAGEDEAKRQNDRVDTAVESMRVELLSTGWKPDSRVYTRADLLEEFLASFIGLKASVESQQENPQAAPAFISPMSVTSAELAAPAVPPVPSKMKDDDLPALERPYSWDMDYSAPKPFATATSEGLDLLTPSFEDVRPRIPLPCPQCALTFLDRGALTWHVEQHDIKHNIEERKAYRFPSRAPIDEEWKPLTPQNAQPDAHRPYVFSPANVMEAPPMEYQPYFQHPLEIRSTVNAGPSTPHEDPYAERTVAELADDRILEKYPTISQLEHRRHAPKPTGRRADERTSAHVSFKEPARARALNHRAKDRGYPFEDIYKGINKLRSVQDGQQQRLSSRMSMPAMTSDKTHASTSGTTPFYQDFPFQASTSAKPTSALHKSASTSFRPAQPYETTSGIQRCNTTAGPSTREQTTRPPAYKPYEPAKYRPATPAPTEQAGGKIADCKARLVEFGFDASHAANVSKLVKGDLEEAINILEEDASVRKTWKGKGRAHGERRRHVPGAFDDEIYG